MPDTQTELSFPRLKPHVIASPLVQYAKCGEELGELSQKLTLLLEVEPRKPRPDDIAMQTIGECMDLAQSAVSMAFAVADIFGGSDSLKAAMDLHIEKMKARDYL